MDQRRQSKQTDNRDSKETFHNYLERIRSIVRESCAHYRMFDKATRLLIMNVQSSSSSLSQSGVNSIATGLIHTPSARCPRATRMLLTFEPFPTRKPLKRL